jgi:hypothetical protein
VGWLGRTARCRDHIHVIHASVWCRFAGRPPRHATKDEEKWALLVPVTSQNNLMHILSS